MINATPYAAQAVPLMERDGRQVIVAIVKATFTLGADGRLVLADRPRPVRVNDEPFEPERPWSSLRYPSDLCPAKVGTDVVVVGEALADPPVTAMDVAVKIRNTTAPLRVHGPRTFYKSATGIAVGPAAKFDRVPIVYELAFGGATADSACVERRNPSGRGVAKRASDLVDTPAPQIEHPAHPITKASDHPDPAGYGSIPAHWLPRADHAGTFDDVWLETRMPILPADFDLRHHNVAHPTLVFDQPLVAGDVIAAMGLSLERVLRFELPDLRCAIDARYDHGERQVIVPRIDTVLFEPGTRTVELTGRAAFAKGRGAMALREVRAELVSG